jgi:hypothetical protein
MKRDYSLRFHKAALRTGISSLAMAKTLPPVVVEVAVASDMSLAPPVLT